MALSTTRRRSKKRSDEPFRTAEELVGCCDDVLRNVDPLEMNLLVAKGTEPLADLGIARYQRILDRWAHDFSTRCLPAWERHFHDAPGDWRNDRRFFRLGMLCQYLDLEQEVAYAESMRELRSVRYTDPRDVFVCGVIDSRRGACASMAALHVAMGWRLGWPVSLACVRSHLILRYDDGTVTYNIEATDTGRGGFSSRTDAQYAEEFCIPAKAIATGSDLRALRPREMLGEFFGLRARHHRDLGNELLETGHSSEATELLDRAEREYLLARHLFPVNRHLYTQSLAETALRGTRIFDAHETGHPATLDRLGQETIRRARAAPTGRPAPATTVCYVGRCHY